MPSRKKDARIVYGMCTWWGSIYEVDKSGVIPTCPHCGSPLYEVENIEAWYKQCDLYPEIDYRKALDWVRGKCSRDLGWEEELAAIQADPSITAPPIWELYLRKAGNDAS